MVLAAFNLPNSEIVTAIYQLLPGFVSAWIFFGFTAHARPTPFERVIQALIFTLFAEALAQLTGFCLLELGERRMPDENWGEWNASASFIWKVGYAVLMGFVFAVIANNNWLHGRLPNWLTKRTSYPSEWFSAFNRTQSHVYLHLDDGRRIYGWPEEWPDSSDSGHFSLMEPEWILPNNERASLPLTQRFVVPASMVKLVEFSEKATIDDEAAELARTESKKIIQYNQSLDSNEEGNDGKKRESQSTGDDEDGRLQRPAASDIE